jgi:hypothetical protein
MCHCLACQRRTGSAFGVQAFPPPTVSVFGSRRHAWLSVPDTIEHEED